MPRRSGCPPRGPESGMMAHMSKSNGSKQLVRSLDGRMVAGVCSGIADCYDIDVNLVRLAFAVASIFGFIGVLAYLAAWVILPEEGAPASIAENMLNKKGNG
jgi:phage shock protein PspC (stress-responsive transcriptional regulator)